MARPRDVTPDAMEDVCDRMMPGFGESDADGEPQGGADSHAIPPKRWGERQRAHRQSSWETCSDRDLPARDAPDPMRRVPPQELKGSNMRRKPTERSILALTYTDGDLAAATLRRLWTRLARRGAKCAGVLQHDEPAGDGRSRCDMILECLSVGRRLKVSEDRGAHARGCRLDVGELMRALEAEREALQASTDVLIVNKFGKSESEGGGFRPLIAQAVELGVPVVITVPWRNIESWRLFVGDLAVERKVERLEPEGDEDLLATIGLMLAPEAAVPSQPTTPVSGSNPTVAD